LIAGKALLQPLNLVRFAALLDGVSLLILLGIAMPLKYAAGLPYAVTVAGTVHGGIFAAYVLVILYAQLRLQWHFKWTIFCLLTAFVPFGNFVLDRFLKRHQHTFAAKNIPAAWLVYAIIFFTFIDLFTQLPVMSTFAASLGASAAIAGFAVGLYSLSNMFGNVSSGLLTDRFGASIVIKIGLLLSSAALLMYRVIDNVTGLLIVRFLHGFLSGWIVPAAFTYLANQTRTEKQGSQSAVTGAFVGIAAIAGPAYSGITASRTSVPFVFSTIAALGLVLFLWTIRSLQPQEKQASSRSQPRQSLKLNRGMIHAFTGAFFLMFSQGALAYLLPLHVESLGYDSRMSGMLLSVFGLVAVAVFVLPTNRLFDRVPPLYSMSVGLAVLGFSQALIGQSSGLVHLYPILALYGLGFSLLFPAMNTLLIHSTTKDNRGQAYGYFYALFSLGVVAGSSGLGLLPASVEAQFLATGLLLWLSVVGIFTTAKREQHKRERQNRMER
jgi:integral membrane protein